MTNRKYKPGKIRERNSENILAAAEQEFVLHGFKGTSMQAVADRAGVAKANIIFTSLYSKTLLLIGTKY